MTLAHLSIQRVGHRNVPHVYTPEERMQAWYATCTPVFANNILAVRRDAPTYFDPPAQDELPARFEDRRGF